jgi:FAD dependent monooxygenase
MMLDRLGYAPAIFERQRFLQSLYDQLNRKEKVHVNKRVTNVLDRGDSVLVKCADGTTYRGDIVVGADGIHSKVRQEMQRLAPPDLLVNDKKSITAEYACFFGVSEPIAELEEGEQHTIFDIGHSALLFVGAGKLPQWFFITKMDRKYYGDEIPRYTEKEMEEQVLEHGNFQFSKGITLKDLMATTTALSYLALEEANHEVWTHKRIVCLGDSVHKMTPNIGQGGNQAIEGAAVLTNCLMEMLSGMKDGSVGMEAIEKTLLKYHSLRAERAQKFVEASGLVTRDEAMATLKHTLRFLFMPHYSSERLTGKSSSFIGDGLGAD